MSVFAGGSAYNMVRDVADGFILVQAPLTDTVLTQKRQRRMQRLTQAMAMANAAAVRRA